MGRLDDAERVEIRSAAEWRAWLADNAERSTGVWLAIPREHGTVRGDLHGPPGRRGAVLRLGRRADVGRRDRFAHLVRAAVSAQRVGGVEQGAGRASRRGGPQDAVRAAARRRRHDERHVVGAGGPEAGVEPPALAAALDADPGARAAWNAFAPSVRTAALTRIALAKGAATVERRIAAVVAACTEGRRPE